MIETKADRLWEYNRSLKLKSRGQRRPLYAEPLNEVSLCLTDHDNMFFTMIWTEAVKWTDVLKC